MIYKTVPAPLIVAVEEGKLSQGVQLFEDVINEKANLGWTYVSMETITVQEKTGCSLNPQPVNTTIHMLIFKKED